MSKIKSTVTSFPDRANADIQITETLALVKGPGKRIGFVLCEKGIQGVCGSCSEQAEGCIPDVLSAKTSVPESFEVRNSYGAKSGDVIRIGITQRSLLVSVLVSYMLPLLGILIGASGAAIMSFLLTGVIGDWPAIIGAFVGLGIGVALAYGLARYLMSEIWAPKMLGVLGAIRPCSDQKKDTDSRGSQ